MSQFNRGICTKDNSIVRAGMLCEIDDNRGFIPNNRLQRRLDNMPNPVHANLEMREQAQCSNCKSYQKGIPK